MQGRPRQVSLTGRCSLTDSVSIGIVTALILGKAIGIFSATFLITKFTRCTLGDGLSWIDVLGLAILAGIGFTVSLLISELAFGADSPHNDHAKVAILTGSLLAALIATVILRLRNKHYRKLEELESVDADGDGIPDVFNEKDD